MNYIENLDFFGVKARQTSCILLHGVPTTSTEGEVGVLGIDVDSSAYDLYKCVGINDGEYIWAAVSSGGDNISIVQDINSESAETDVPSAKSVYLLTGDINEALEEIIELQEKYIRDNAPDIKFYIDDSEYMAKENVTWNDFFSIQENVDTIGYFDYGDGLVRIYGGVFWLLYNDGTTVKPTDEIIADYNYSITNV